jgi:hypothetical protein
MRTPCRPSDQDSERTAEDADEESHDAAGGDAERFTVLGHILRGHAAALVTADDGRAVDVGQPVGVEPL